MNSDYYATESFPKNRISYQNIGKQLKKQNILNEKPTFSKETKEFFQVNLGIKYCKAEKIFEEVFYELNHKLSQAFFKMKIEVFFILKLNYYY